MRDEGAGLGTTGLGAAHGFLSEDRGASYGYMGEGPEAGPLRKKFRPVAGIGPPAMPGGAMPSAQARIGSQADAQHGMAAPRGDFGHAHERHVNDDVSRLAHESGRPSPIPEAESGAAEPYEHIDSFHHTSQIDPEGSREDEPFNLGIAMAPSNVPIADVGPADGGQQPADDFLETDNVDAHAQNMLDNIGHSDKFDLGNAYHFEDTNGRHEAAPSHAHHDHAIRGTNQREDEIDRAEQYPTPGGLGAAMVNPFANVGGTAAPPIARHGTHPTDPFAGGDQFQYVRGGSPAPEGSNVPLIQSDAEYMRNVVISPTPDPTTQTMSDKDFMASMQDMGPSMQSQMASQIDKDAEIAAGMAGGDMDLERQEPMDASLAGAAGGMASVLDEIEAGRDTGVADETPVQGQLKREASKALKLGRGYSGENVHAADDYTTAQIDAAVRASMPGGGRGVGTGAERARAAAIPSVRSSDPREHTDEKTSADVAALQSTDAQTLAAQQARDDPHSLGAQEALGDAQLDPGGWERDDYLRGGQSAADFPWFRDTDRAAAHARAARGRGRGRGRRLTASQQQQRQTARTANHQRALDARFGRHHPMHSRNGGFNGAGAREWMRRGRPPWNAGHHRTGRTPPPGGLPGMMGKIKLEDDPFKPPKKPRADTPYKPELWGWASPELNPKKKRMTTPWGGGGHQQYFDPIKPPVNPPIPPAPSPPAQSPKPKPHREARLPGEVAVTNNTLTPSSHPRSHLW